MNDERYSDPAEIRHTIGAQGTLSLQTISGSVELRATDSDEVVVRAVSENGRGEDLPIVVRRTDGGLHIEAEKRTFEMFGSFFRGHSGIDFSIEVPRAAQVEIKTVSADVSARSLAGDQIYKTVSGDVSVDADGGRLRLTTVSGDIELRPSASVEVDINTTSGDINVRGASLRNFNARTVSGDVEVIAGLDSGSLHTIETVSGDFDLKPANGVSVEVRRGMDMGRGEGRTLVAGDGAAQVRFRTLSGDAHVSGAERQKRSDRRERHGGRLERDLGSDIELKIKRSLRGLGIDIDEPPLDSEAPAAGEPPPADEPHQPAMTQLEVLQALERGEMDVEEASRRLQEVS